MSYIIGIDEVGYGAVAGPVTVCAVCVDENWKGPEGLKDSKLMSQNQIRKYHSQLMAEKVLWHRLYSCSAREVDQRGAYKILGEMHAEVLKHILGLLPVKAYKVIIDGNRPIKGPIPCFAVPKADGTIPCVMAASVIAKFTRDEYMRGWHTRYPAYGFDVHKGYLTPKHAEAIERAGLSPIHRASYPKLQELAGRRSGK